MATDTNEKIRQRLTRSGKTRAVQMALRIAIMRRRLMSYWVTTSTRHCRI